MMPGVAEVAADCIGAGVTLEAAGTAPPPKLEPGVELPIEPPIGVPVEVPISPLVDVPREDVPKAVPAVWLNPSEDEPVGAVLWYIARRVAASLTASAFLRKTTCMLPAALVGESSTVTSWRRRASAARFPERARR